MVFIKYVEGLGKSIQKVLKLFNVEGIIKAILKAMGIEKILT